MMVQAVEDESGDLTSQRDVEFRQHCERSKPRVVWNAETRCYLSALETETLMRSLSRCSIWPVEMTRVLSAATGKGKSKDETQLSVHGVAYMDLASLLYPGATRVFGAYPVVGFSETDQSNRTGHRNIRSILDVIYPKPNAAGEKHNPVQLCFYLLQCALSCITPIAWKYITVFLPILFVCGYSSPCYLKEVCFFQITTYNCCSSTVFSVSNWRACCRSVRHDEVHVWW